MCGIAVIQKFRTEASRAELTKMCSTLRHRGPDGQGFARLNQGRVLFGHVRLGIIDLERGDQPLFNEDGSICLVFNGEIYDYRAHREALRKEGHHFRTQSDSEVIIHLYEQYGLDFFSKLNGEFALVIWDQKKRRLIAAKDRFGIKPLFYREDASQLLFSSEAKGILAITESQREISADFVAGPLFGAIENGTTPFKGIRSVRPGHFLTVTDEGEISERPYWAPNFDLRPEISFEEACAGVKEKLTAAVKRRQVADVPVGTYLSGGLDSTLVASVMAKTGQKPKAFNIGFSDNDYDEAPLSAKIADYYGLEFETVRCNPETLLDGLLDCIWHVEGPITNLNSVAKQLLSKYVNARGYKVCQTGEGADEIFGGYPYFKLEQLWRMNLAGGESKRHSHRLLNHFYEMESRSEGILWRKGINPGRMPQSFGYPSIQEINLVALEKKLNFILSRDVRKKVGKLSPLTIFRQQFPAEEMRKLDPFNASRKIALNLMSHYIIPKLGDRVEMANSLECRTPFLDVELVEYVLRLKPDYFTRISDLSEKHLLREAFAHDLPPFMRGEHKHPFVAPGWTQILSLKRGREIFAEYLSPQSVREAGLFNPHFVKALNLAWRWLPPDSGLRKQLDAAMGMIFSVQAMSKLFRSEASYRSVDFELVDRSYPEVIR